MYVGAAHSSDIVTFKTIPTGELEIIHNTSTRSSSRSGVTRQTDPPLDFRRAIHHGIILVHDRPKQIDMEPLPVRFQYRFDQSYVSRYALFDHSALQVSCRHARPIQITHSWPTNIGEFGPRLLLRTCIRFPKQSYQNQCELNLGICWK